MSGFLDANADGLALIVWVMCGLSVLLVVGATIEVWAKRWMRRRRHERGQWWHQATREQVAREARAQRPMASDT